MKDQYQITGIKVFNPSEAVSLGYESLTTPYMIKSKDDATQDREVGLWEKMLDQMSGCNCIAVEFTDGYEIWRHSSEMNIDPITGGKITRYIKRF